MSLIYRNTSWGESQEKYGSHDLRSRMRKILRDSLIDQDCKRVVIQDVRGGLLGKGWRQ